MDLNPAGKLFSAGQCNNKGLQIAIKVNRVHGKKVQLNFIIFCLNNLTNDFISKK